MTGWGIRIRIRIPHTVRTLAEHDVRAALPDETGGILIGWRERRTVVVSRVLVVPDLDAAIAHYTLNHDAAQAALDRHRRDHPDEAEGYVGDWHSHPEPQPPSPLDRRSISEAAAQLELPIAMLVIAYDANSDTMTTYGHVVYRRRLRRSILITPALIHATKDPA